MNAVSETVGMRKVPAKLNDAVQVDRIHNSCSGLAGQQRKNAWTTAQIQDRITRTHRRFDGGLISGHTHGIGKHGGELIQGVESGTHLPRLIDHVLSLLWRRLQAARTLRLSSLPHSSA